MGVSGTIKERFGFYGNFSLGIAIIMCCLIYTIFFLKDSRELRPAEVQKQIDALEKRKQENQELQRKKGRCATLFDVDNVKSAFKAVFKKRRSNLRTFILVLGIIFIGENLSKIKIFF